MPTLELADDSSSAAGVLDLRGRVSASSHAVGVLEDPSGRRRVRMRWLGRVVGACLCVWLVALVLSGLGLIPRGVVPLAGVLTATDGARSGNASSTLPRHNGPAAPPHDGAATRRPAGAAPSRTSAVKRDSVASDGTSRRGSVGARPRRAPRAAIVRPRGGVTLPGRPTEPGGSPRQAVTAPNQAAAPGKSDSAPGQMTAPGHSDSAPRQTTTPGQTDSTPGKTTAPGQGDSAPRQTTAPGQTDSATGQTTAPGQTRSEAGSRTETAPTGSGQAREHSPVLGGGQS